MSKKKKQIRDEFRQQVFNRDSQKCVICGKAAQDAHHITDRNDMPNGGYVLENGISLCSDCHKSAEEYHISKGLKWIDGFHPNQLYAKINSSYELALHVSRNGRKFTKQTFNLLDGPMV